MLGGRERDRNGRTRSAASDIDKSVEERSQVISRWKSVSSRGSRGNIVKRLIPVFVVVYYGIEPRRYPISNSFACSICWAGKGEPQDEHDLDDAAKRTQKERYIQDGLLLVHRCRLRVRSPDNTRRSQLASDRCGREKSP